MTIARDVIAAARAYLGTRFAHQGRSADGLDCLGLLIATADDLGLAFNNQPASTLDVPQYGSRPDVVMLKKKLDGHLVSIHFNEARAADIALLKIDGSPQHLALLTDYPLASELGMIHAYAPARQVTEHRYDPHWRRATYALYRLPQLAE